jgi:hypothetical protein
MERSSDEVLGTAALRLVVMGTLRACGQAEAAAALQEDDIED